MEKALGYQWQPLAPTLAAPSPGVPAYNEGLRLARAQDYKAAIVQFGRSIAADPKFVPAYVARGISYTAQRDLKLARADAERAVELAPTNIGGLLLRAMLLAQNPGERDKALADYEKVIQLQPRSADALVGRGWMRIAKEQNDKAIQDFDAAIAINPKSSAAFQGRGKARMQKSDKAAAIADLRMAVELDPASASAREMLNHAITFKPGGTLLSNFGAAMEVSIVKAGQPGCEPNCPEWISAEGEIDVGTPAKFSRVLAAAGKRKLPVFIHSFGGLASAGFEIGRMIHERGLDVVVSRSVVLPCAADDAACQNAAKIKATRAAVPIADQSRCVSSCVFVLAAGKNRVAGKTAGVGVHQAARYQEQAGGSRKGLLGGRFKLAETGEAIYGKMTRYFVEMGVDKSIMPLLKSATHDDVHWMTEDEFKSTKIVTLNQDGEQYLAALIPEWTIEAQHAAAKAAQGVAAADVKKAAEADEAAAQTRKLVQRVEESLRRVGCFSGEADGRWDARPKRALERFAKATNRQIASDEPSEQLAVLVDQQQQRVCHDAPKPKPAAPAAKPSGFGFW